MVLPDMPMQPSVHDTDHHSPLLPPDLLARIGELSRGLDEARRRVSRGFIYAPNCAPPATRCGTQRNTKQTAPLPKKEAFSLSIVIPALVRKP